MLELGGATLLMGGDDPDGFPDDREGPVREVRVEPFAISAHVVTSRVAARSRNTPDSSTGHMGFRVAGNPR